MTRGELARVALVSINLLFFSLSAGMAASALCRRDRAALGLSALMVLLLVGAWPLGQAFQRHPDPNSRAALLSSPAYGCYMAFDSFYKANGRGNFALNALATQFYAWTFLALACWRTPRSWQEKGPTQGWRRRLSSQGLSPRRAALRARLLAVNPFLWRAARGTWKQTLVWLPLGSMALLWFWAEHFSGIGWFEPALDLVRLVAGGLILKILVADEAGRTLAEDRRSGALELILATPLRVEEIVRGQLFAVRRRFLAPVAAVLLANGWLLLMELRHGPNLSLEPEDRMALILMHLTIAAFLVLDIIAISWVALWRGLLASKPARAWVPAFLSIVPLPGLVFFLGATLLEWDPGWSGSLFSWALLSLAAIGLFAPNARRNALHHFRAVASGDYRRRWWRVGRAKVK